MAPAIKIHIVYRIWALDATLLYVGRTHLAQIADRIAYARAKHWAAEIERITLDFLPSREATHDAELLAIRTERPRYNYQGLHPIGEAAFARGLPHCANGIDRQRDAEIEAKRSLLSPEPQQ
jgi:hypothetical protein